MINRWYKKILLYVTAFSFMMIFASVTFGTEQAEEQYNQLMDRINEHYQAQQFDQAITSAIQAVALADEEFGEEHALTTTAIYTLAQLYQAQGLLREAETQYLKLLEVYQQSFDVGELDIAIARESLASVYLALGRFQEAERQYIQVLNTKTSVLGEEHPEVTYTTGGLAELYRRMGFYDKAEPLFELALEQIRDQRGRSFLLA